MSTIVVTEHEGWAHLRIDRPDKRNALNRAARAELDGALQTLKGRARAIVLTGTDRWFCCGADLKERAQRLAEGLPDTAGAEGIDLAMAIRDFPGVAIAAVNGLALGYGVNLVNCCDLALAADSAQLGLPELRSAAYASMSAATSQLAGVGRKRLGWLLFNAEPIDAGVACDWGLVNAVVPAAQLAARAEALAQKIAGFDPVAIAETKAALARVPPDPSDWRTAMELGQSVNPRIRQGRAGA
jgi:enoyl-CoA hydratase/carnithine racemase